MAHRFTFNQYTTHRIPSYYASNRLYKDAHTRNEITGRTSRRIHDGLTVDRMYGLDTTSDDINSSPYSSPYYINGRYNSDNLYTQRGSAASVQGVTYIASLYDDIHDFTDEDIQTTIELWQGKQIKFTIPYSGKVVGNTITLKNTSGCTGILVINVSTKDGAEPVYKTAIDLCEISQDKFEHRELRSITTIPRIASARGKLYVRMEIIDEISKERSNNPFNTGRKIEIAATGLDNHYAAVVTLGEKNAPVSEVYNYERKPNRPCFGLIYNEWVSVPTNRIEAAVGGATVSINGYKYDIYCFKGPSEARVAVFDKEMGKFVSGTQIAVDGRIKALNLVQAKDYVYYVDGYSPVQKFKIGEWTSSPLPLPSEELVTVSVDLTTFEGSPLGDKSGIYTFTKVAGDWKYAGETVTLSTYGITVSGPATNNSLITVTYTKASEGGEADIAAAYTDTNPVVSPSIITLHNNRIYISGFRNDPNLVQFTEIKAEGPDFESYPYRFYAPDESPLATSYNPITSIVEYESNSLMITGKTFYSLYQTDGGSRGATAETSMPVQITMYTDGGGVQSAGDILNYHGVMYSFDQDEGLRRFTGAVWNVIPNSIDSYWERVDMDKPRKLWGYANKIYYSYTDKVDSKYKTIIWDMEQNYQQYPFYQDVDLPFCDVRYDDDYNLFGAHPDYPCIMKLYDENVWRRMDTPIDFVRYSKYMVVPGISAEMVLKRVRVGVLANVDRHWYVGFGVDKNVLEQHRNNTTAFRIPCWATITDKVSEEALFANQDAYLEDAISYLMINNIRSQCTSVQVRIRCQTFREQASVVSMGIEIQPTNLN